MPYLAERLIAVGAKWWATGADLAAMVRDAGRPKERHGVTESVGIAKGFWKNADVQGYLEEERASWELYNS